MADDTHALTLNQCLESQEKVDWELLPLRYTKANLIRVFDREI